ncbi:CHAT domain-containing protein [Almyronema epifaneia]|uniref:CHAT domain-containing protein n=1 Tax=Almyronema epifaneia S1 TaxID=2991925 RepID=A0ABW6I9Q9_9CYAN
MKYLARLLGLAAIAAMIVPAIQIPGFSEEPRDLDLQSASSILLAQDNNVSEHLAEANTLLEQGLEQLEEVEDLRQASRELFNRVFIEETLLFEDDLERRDYYISQAEEIQNQIEQIQTDIAEKLLQALELYRNLHIRTNFPLESHKGEQSIVTVLIELDFEAELFQPQEIRELVLNAIASHRSLNFRSAFPLESRQGEQNIVIKLMMPTMRHPGAIIDEVILQSQEIKDLVQETLKSYQENEFRDMFPVESRQGELQILTVLSPLSRRPFQRRELLQPQERLQFLQQLLESYRSPSFRENFSVESRQGEGEILAKLMFIYLFEMEQPEQAIEAYEQGQGLFIANEIKDRILAAKVLNWAKSIYWFLKEYDKVIEISEEYLKLIEEAEVSIQDGSDPIINEEIFDSNFQELKPQELEEIIRFFNKLEAENIYDIGTAYLALGQPQKAIEFYERSAALSEDCFCYIDRIVSVPLNLGVAYWLSGSYEEAAEIYSELGISVSGYPRVMAGLAYDNLAQYHEAISFYEQNLEAILNKDYASKVEALHILGRIYTSLGNYQQAVNIYQQSIQLIEQHSSNIDLEWQGIIHADLGYVYLNLKEYEKAIRLFEYSLPLIQQAIQEKIISNPYGDYNAFETGKSITESVVLRNWEAILLSNFGAAYAGLTDYSKAIEFLEESLMISYELGDYAGQSKALGNLGNIFTELGDYQQAGVYYQQALTVARELSLQADEGLWLSRLGHLLVTQGQTELGITFYKQSVNVRESIRESIQGLSEELQQSFTDTIADDYRLLADLLLQQNRILEAQRVLDLLKVQELDEYLRDVRGNSNTQTGVDYLRPEATILARYEERQQSAIALGQELETLKDIAEDERSEAQNQRIAQLTDLLDEINSSFREFTLSPEIRTLLEQLSYEATRASIYLDQLDSLRDELQQLNAAIFYPLILEDRLELVITTPDSPPLRRTVPVTKAELNEAILAFRQALTQPSSDIEASAQQLYDWLVRPLEDDLAAAGVETIIYAPDGQLRYIPLAALHDGNQWLTQRYRVNNITAASLTDLTQADAAQPRILAAAYTDETLVHTPEVNGTPYTFTGLPGAGLEVETLSAERTFLNQAFSLSAVRPIMDEYTVLHLATHAAFVPGVPEDSFILFGNGDTPTLRDIEGWTLNGVDLVVLSACETGVGGLGNGEEILGLGYTFQLRGARAVLSSLWQVSDQGTQVLMTAFYDALSQGMTKAEALQQAQVALITGDFSAVGGSRAGIGVVNQQTGEAFAAENLDHPYYWAPFILIGNGL